MTGDELWSGDDDATTTANFPGDVDGDGDRERAPPTPPTPGLAQFLPDVGRKGRVAFGTGFGPVLLGLFVLPFAPLPGVVGMTAAATLALGAAYRHRKDAARSPRVVFYLAGLAAGTLAGLLALGLLSALTAIAGVAA